MPTPSHRTIAAIALVAITVVAAACSEDDATTDPASSPPDRSVTTSVDTDADGAGEGFPVQVEHRFGETVVEAPPERIVAIGPQWTDVLLALDVQPVAVDLAVGTDETGRYPWQGALSDDTELLTITDGIPFEQVAALQPDLILVTHAASEQAAYDTLAAIAPTVALLGDRQVDRWEDLADVAGRVLGREDDAAAMVDDVHAVISQTAADLPGLDGTTFLLVNHLPGDTMWVVADEDDGASVLFEQLGMSIPADVLTLADGVTGRAQMSLEQVDLLESDLLIMLNNGADPHDLVGYDALESVRSGAAVDIDLATVIALNTPTPLGIPHALDVIRPALEAAAR